MYIFSGKRQQRGKVNTTRVEKKKKQKYKPRFKKNSLKTSPKKKTTKNDE